MPSRFDSAMSADLYRALEGDHGVDVTFGAQTGRGILDLETESFDSETGAAVVSDRPSVILRESSWSPMPSRGDELEVDGGSYIVGERRREGPDGVRLMLVEST